MIELRDYQIAILDKLRAGFAEGHRAQMLYCPTGGGKCLGYGTPVLMADGRIIPVQDVREGDALMGPDGQPRNVLTITSGREMLYRVTPVKGDPYVVNASHILSLRATTGADRFRLSDGTLVPTDGGIVNVNVETYLRSSATAKHCLKGWRAGAIESFMRDDDEDDRGLPPYILGAWLGDGKQGAAVLCKPMCNMVKEWISYGESIGYGVRNETPNDACGAWRLTNGKDGYSYNLVQGWLEILGVLHDRHIPDSYKFGPLDVRREVLAGLIDSDGHIYNSSCCDWVSKSETLARDFAFVCRSVGLACYLSKEKKTIRETGFEAWYWRASVSGDLSDLPMRDKIAEKRQQKKRHLVHGISVEPMEEGEYFGFEIDGDRLFLLGDFTVTHNTEMGISLMKAASDKYNRSAMVLDRIVLCNQTSERLDKYSIDHGVLQSGHWRHRPYERIQVCSAQTLEKRGSLPDMKLLIIDEAHQTRAQTIEFIKNNPGIKVVGLSATPFTKGLGSIYTNVVSAITTQQLVEQGKLAPLRVYVGKEIDMNGAKKVAGEWSSKEAETRGIKITGDIVAEWVKKTHEVFGGPRKTIVFAAGVAHAADLARQFGEAGYNFVSLSYRDDDDFKAEAIREFSKPDTSIHGLIATDILTKGFDVPDVMIGVSARPFSKSLASHIQQLGRVMRSSPGKEFALWLCVARGSQVLTDRGLVPIEEVSLSDKIWDGTNFVPHGGAVCNGIQKTITYQGLTATPGHLVHTAQGWRTFGDCASEQIRITQTGLGGQAIRISEDNFARRIVAWAAKPTLYSCRVRVRELRKSIGYLAHELTKWAHKGMPTLQPACASVSNVAIQPSAGNACAVHEPVVPAVCGIRREGRGIPIQRRQGRDALDYAKSWIAQIFKRCGAFENSVGQNRSVRPLRTGKPSLARRWAESTEQAREPSGSPDAQVPVGASGNSVFGRHSQAVLLERNDERRDHSTVLPSFIETEREVWDILDCGPNNRFTCEGLLVHNCHSGNYLGFQEAWEDVYVNGIDKMDEGKEKPRKEPTQHERERAVCPRCGTVWLGRRDDCAACGFVRPRLSEVIATPGELQELNPGSNTADKELKQRWYSELLSVAHERGYSDGWVANKYRERFSIWPRNLERVEIPVSPEVARWVKSRQIAWAKSRRAA